MDGITGTETNERENIDTDAWMQIGPSATMQAVYLGEALQSFWANLFGIGAVDPLSKQTFLRLMGESGTQEHADYYYFKRDTHIFEGKHCREAIAASERYLIEHNLPLPKLDANIANSLKTVEMRCNFSNNNNNNNNRNTNHSNKKQKGEELLLCHICEKYYLMSSLDETRLKRLKKGGFGVQGEWHCPNCAIKPLGVYTTWMSLSDLKVPKDSILAICPKSHLLRQWDVPKPKDKQLCNDFSWKMPWVIPYEVAMGDIVIFNIKTIHASSFNATNPKTFRLSCDTRIILTSNGNQQLQKKVNNNEEEEMFFARNNPSPHPPLSAVKRHGKSKKILAKNIKDSTKNPYFGGNESHESESDEYSENDGSQSITQSESKSDVDSENNENENDCNVCSNNDMNRRPRIMTRSQARKMKEMYDKDGYNNGNGQLKRISKQNKGGSKDETDALTDSMSDLKLIA